MLICLLALCILLTASACSLPNPSAPEEKVFSIGDYNMQITANTDFHEKTGGSFDLQITNDKCYISIMAFRYIDLPADTTPFDVFDLQNEDLLGRREKVVTIEDARMQVLTKGSLTNSLYSAEKDGVKNYYGSYLMDLPSDESFAWILVTAAPSYFEHNRADLERIVSSLKSIA